MARLRRVGRGPLPLRVDLGSLGLPGCSLLADPLATIFLIGVSQAASWTWNLPNDPAFFATQFYNQAFVLDGPANSAGFTVSNGGAGRLGL